MSSKPPVRRAGRSLDFLLSTVPPVVEPSAEPATTSDETGSPVTTTAAPSGAATSAGDDSAPPTAERAAPGDARDDAPARTAPSPAPTADAGRPAPGTSTDQATSAHAAAVPDTKPGAERTRGRGRAGPPLSTIDENASGACPESTPATSRPPATSGLRRARAPEAAGEAVATDEGGGRSAKVGGRAGDAIKPRPENSSAPRVGRDVPAARDQGGADIPPAGPERPARRGPGRPVKHTGAVRRVVTDRLGREREQRWERVNVILTEEVDALDALADDRLVSTGYRPSRSDLLRAFTRAILAAGVDFGGAATERQIQQVIEAQLRAGADRPPRR